MKRKLKSLVRAFFEPLEFRALLSTDLTGTIEVLNPPTVFTPGITVTPVLNIVNQDEAVPAGSIEINVYLSTDQTLDASDTLVRAITVVNPGSFAPIDFTVPNGLAGKYFILADIDPGHEIADDDFSNNVASTPNATPAAFQFGNVNGKANLPLTYVDPTTSGGPTTVTVKLKGAGIGELVSTPDGFDINITGTNSDTAVAIRAQMPGAYPYTLVHDVNVSGSLKSFIAPAVNLTGGFHVTASGVNNGSVGALTLLYASRCDIEIPGADVPLAIKFYGGALEATLTAGSAIKSISAFVWQDGSITAPSIGSFHVADQSHALTVDLVLSGEGVVPGRKTLADARAVEISGGTWVIAGNVGTIAAQRIDQYWSASISGRIGALTTELEFSTCTLAAAQIGKIDSDTIVGTNIFAGANFGSDGRLGGTGSAADTFAAGSIRSVTSNTAINSVIAAGLNPVDGVPFNGDDSLFAGGSIGSLTVKNPGYVGSSYIGHFIALNFPGPVLFKGTRVVPDSGADQRFAIPHFSTTTPTVMLDGDSDSGTHGDGFTTLATVTIVGVADPGVIVRLPSQNLSTTSDFRGNFTFSRVALEPGANQLSFYAINAYGYTSAATSLTITRVVSDAANGIATATATIAHVIKIDDTTYRYTVTLLNTGPTVIETFRFAWLNGYNLLPVKPFNIQSPADWGGRIDSQDFYSSPNFGIEWTTTSAPLAVGDSLTFEFDSTAPPVDLIQTPYVAVAYVFPGAALDDRHQINLNGSRLDVVTVGDPDSLPVVTARLANDNGVSDSDNVTSDAAIEGTVTDPDGIALLRICPGPTFNIYNSYDVTANLVGDAFLIYTNQLYGLHRSYNTFLFQAVDTLGNPSELFTLSFTYDPPVAVNN